MSVCEILYAFVINILPALYISRANAWNFYKTLDPVRPSFNLGLIFTDDADMLLYY